MIAIRNSAKAIIIENGKILFTKNKDHLGFFYLLPGGGQEHGECLIEALKRECMEEISADVSVGDIRFIREYIGKNHEFAEWDSEIHQIEYMFECKLLPGAKLKNGAVPDTMQIGVEWLDLERLGDYRIYPNALKDVINEDGTFKSRIYLGDAN
ncbi:MAG TPA: NUDIX domain-containing protein [Clostridia bacterium]|nr:NUDIX domain-containing protein [Clostridia bacterium]